MKKFSVLLLLLLLPHIALASELLIETSKSKVFCTDYVVERMEEIFQIGCDNSQERCLALYGYTNISNGTKNYYITSCSEIPGIGDIDSFYISPSFVPGTGFLGYAHQHCGFFASSDCSEPDKLLILTREGNINLVYRDSWPAFWGGCIIE